MYALFPLHRLRLERPIHYASTIQILIKKSTLNFNFLKLFSRDKIDIDIQFGMDIAICIILDE